MKVKRGHIECWRSKSCLHSPAHFNTAIEPKRSVLRSRLLPHDLLACIRSCPDNVCLPPDRLHTGFHTRDCTPNWSPVACWLCETCDHCSIHQSYSVSQGDQQIRNRHVEFCSLPPVFRPYIDAYWCIDAYSAWKDAMACHCWLSPTCSV